ncbi:MAG: AtpZ/AtpI family protein [Desulfobaccales bacterium]|jgi:ATP synthase protein I
MKEDTKKFLKELMTGGYRASSIGLSLVLAIVIGGGLGYWLNSVTGKSYWFYIGLILGIIAGFRNLYILGKKYEDK